jgi:hypothetical protein
MLIWSVLEGEKNNGILKNNLCQFFLCVLGLSHINP